jgi:hypothetical protein
LRLQIKTGKPDFLVAAAELITSALCKKSHGTYRRWLSTAVRKYGYVLLMARVTYF